MQEVAKKFYSLEEYLALEATSEAKHEYYNGEIFAMAGGTFQHAMITINLTTTLKKQLAGKKLSRLIGTNAPCNAEWALHLS
jgi:Uma2 family endonuclease